MQIVWLISWEFVAEKLKLKFLSVHKRNGSETFYFYLLPQLRTKVIYLKMDGTQIDLIAYQIDSYNKCVGRAGNNFYITCHISFISSFRNSIFEMNVWRDTKL